MRAWLGAIALVSAPSLVAAQDPGREGNASVPVSARVEPISEDSPRVRFRVAEDTFVRVGGYLEAFYAWNFNQPSNGITEFRAFDNRHNQFTVQALALDLSFASRHFEVRLVGQTGNGPATYVGASEPTRAGTALTPPSNAQAWQHLQQAWIAWTPFPGELTLDAGLFLSPIGPENLPTYQNRHWSHSVLFFALPFYHAGARVRWSPAKGHALRVGLMNGWNNALDNNDEKTLGVDYAFTALSTLAVGVAYLGGVERPTGAPEGRAWRHLLDLWADWQLAPRVALLAELNTGVEPNTFGTSGWAAGNLSVRVQLVPWLFAAARTTLFWEHRAASAGGVAAPIAIPAGRLASHTLTLEALPVVRGLSFKLEGRFDSADAPIYFAGRVEGDGSPAAPFLPNAREQLTLTLGATAWF